jgi:pimeloyl-[acyl-carrier protein] synthase
MAILVKTAPEMTPDYNPAMSKIWNRFPVRMRRAITTAAEQAAARGCDEVAVEHLLAVICADPDSAACFVFEQAGVSREQILDRMLSLSPSGDGPLHRQRAARLSPAAMHVLDIAAGEADRWKHKHIGTEHVALALAIVNHNGASEVLRELKFTHARAEAGVKRWFDDNMERRLSGEPRKPILSRWLGKLPSPVRKGIMLPWASWKIFFGRSLGHPGFVTNPYPLYRWLRERHPIRLDPLAPVWVLTRHADIATILKDSRFTKDPFAAERLPAMMREQLGVRDEETRTPEVETLSMLFLDPPKHTRVRSIFSKAFTPKMIAGLRPRIQQITDKRLEKVLATGEMDIIAAIAYPLPVVVIAELLGFPPEDYPLYKKWSDDFTAALGFYPSAAELTAAAVSRRELLEYFNKLVADLEKRPSDNLLSALISMEHEPGALSREELFINSALLLAAGHETTTNLIGTGLWQLMQNPDQLKLLRDNPDLIESAVEELLRFDSPVQWVSRVVGERLELGGVTLEAGAVLLGALGAANRDPTVFDNPEQMDIRRSDNRHLSFGSGVHFCLGATLARIEAQIAIGSIVQRCGNLRITQRKVVWKKGLVFRAIRELRVKFDPV